jgi:hypothetical protein
MSTLLRRLASNGCATHGLIITVAVVVLSWPSRPVFAQTAQGDDGAQDKNTQHEGRVSLSVRFLAGGLAGLVAHETGHFAFDVAFDADPRLKRVEFHGIPFFAIAHRAGLSPRRELIISSAGFWVQHAGSEWILTRRPDLRSERAPFFKGIVAFNVLTSTAYAGAAFARTGPDERDTRGIARSASVDERWIGALVLAPAVLDAWRYFDPDAAWAKWASRAVKIGMVLLVIR